MEVIFTDNHTRAVSLDVSTDVGEARRAAAAACNRQGMTVAQQADARIIASELAQNVVKHARHGELLIGTIRRGGRAGVELMALDNGPGIRDVQRCLRDGFSSAGTSGTGLGAIKRLAETFDIYSPVGGGTVALARMWDSPPPDRQAPDRGPRVGAVSVAPAEEDVCGDNWAWKQQGRYWDLLVADGLGHGREAAEASSAAVKLFQTWDRDPAGWFAEAHITLRRMRGVAAAWTRVDPVGGRLKYWGVGNIAGAVLGHGQPQRLVSRYGTIGVTVGDAREFVASWSAESVLMLHSDGLVSRWQTDIYPGLLRQDASIIAGVLYRDYQRGKDDVTVVAVKPPVV